MFEKLPKRISYIALVALFVAGVALLLTGCGDDTTTGNDDDDNNHVDNEVLSIGNFMSGVSNIEMGSATAISGAVIDTGSNGVSDVQVLFYANPIESGYFTKAVDTTGSDGLFNTEYVPLDTGDVTISVQLGNDPSVSASRSVTVSGTGTVPGPQDFSFEFFVPEGFIFADGVSTVDIQVIIHVGTGVPAPNGTLVKLEAGERFTDINGDGYFTENIDEVNWDANENGIWDKIGSVPASVTTVDSVASFTYTTGTQSGFVFIRATVGNPGDSIVGELALSLRPSEEVSYIKMSAASSEVQVKATGGIESTNLTAYCYDKYGNLVQQDVEVEFYIISGPNGGENIEEQGYGPVTALTNIIGGATVTLLSGTISGTVATQAKVGTVTSDVVLIDVNAGPPYNISVGVDPCNIRGCDRINVEATVVALVEDVYDNPVMDSTVVYFTTNVIGMVDASSVTKDGIAESTFRSTDDCLNGRARIIAETDGGRVKDSTLLWVSGPPASVEIYSYPAVLMADGADAGKVYAEVLDANGVFVLNGTDVEFDFWPEWSIADATTSDGCYASIAESKLSSQPLSKDYSYTIPDDGVGAYGLLTATAGAGGGVSHTVTVQINTGASHSSQSQILVSSKVAPGSCEPVVIIIKDRAGNPLGGHLLTAYASNGWMTTDSDSTDVDSVYTNLYGEGVGYKYIAPLGLGYSYITVVDLDPSYGGLVLTKKIKIDNED